MKTIHTPSSRFKSILRDMEVAGRAGWRLAKSGARTLSRMPWPVLLVAAIALAALVTIVPLVLGLFIALLVLKFVAGIVFNRGPRDIEVYKPHDPQHSSQSQG
ncbi:hypothetical protein [Massilia sp.]|uniref:hypothetical protein n=1 Tax=Massilia sp. TaxID=1882437 RepID=UPI002899511C|nr:hypothetical protein [Massilia sp.]